MGTQKNIKQKALLSEEWSDVGICVFCLSDNLVPDSRDKPCPFEITISGNLSCILLSSTTAFQE